ncbi:MAG: hypothetical protein V2A73_16290 [Pseudomonadota bacterium]
MTKAPVFPWRNNRAGTIGDGNLRFFDDDGNPFYPHLTPTPELCFSCTKHESKNQQESMFCNLARADKEIDEVFVCFAYQPTSPAVDREALLRDLCEKARIEYSEEDLTGEDGEEDDEPIPF